MNWLRRTAPLVCLSLLLVRRLCAQEAVGETIVVTASREPNPAATSPFAIEVVAEEELRRAPQLRLDDILRDAVPGFSLFRRSSSRVANPTTQGVTLRNFGPSGAGRTLVLLDGIPLNDPFAGYVLWNEVPPAAIGEVIVTPGGGAGLFGNTALAGTIFLQSRRAESVSAETQLLIGDHDTYSGSAFGTVVDRNVTLTSFAEYFSTSGYPVLQANQRGSVDNNANAHSALLQLKADVSLGKDSSLALQMCGFREERGNGTIYTHNDTVGGDASAVFIQRFPTLEAELRISGYGQMRKFRSTFGSINAQRDVETPALNQYDVPADAAGGSVVWGMTREQHALTLGADARWVTGETNELFRFVANSYTRDRNAGGEQLFVGFFAEDRWQLSDAISVTGGARLDHWQLSDASRTERDLTTGRTTLHTDFPDRDGYNANGRLGTIAKVTETISLRAAGYTGFRLPTLNELYRPFRVGNVVTEANANLDPERLIGGEAALEWRPVKAVQLGATFFYNHLEDAVGNVTVGFGPGNFDPGGFIPVGGVLRQRRNIDLVTAPGAELGGSWQITNQLFVRASYLFTQPTVDRAAERALIGKLLAQTPEHVITGALEWHPEKHALVTVQARYSSRQFEDDQNAIPLAPYLTVDLAAFYDFSEHLSVGVKVENLLNTDIETGKTPDGLVSIGAPRLVTVQLRYQL